MTRILAIGDVHVGSYSAVMPEVGVVKDVGTGDEIEVRPSRQQRLIRKEWKRMLDDAGKVDICIVNGDICDGPAKRSEGLNQWTTNKKAQAENAVTLLKEIRAKKFKISWGSKYHVEENMNLDEYVADLLSRSGRDAEYAPRFIEELKKEGFRMHIQHYVAPSKATWQYLTTPLARDMVLMKLNDSRKKYGDVDIVLRSHIHFYVDVGYSSSRGITLPGWEGPTPYSVMKGIITPPEIGYVIIDVNGDGSYDWSQRVTPVVPVVKVFED